MVEVVKARWAGRIGCAETLAQKMQLYLYIILIQCFWVLVACSHNDSTTDARALVPDYIPGQETSAQGIAKAESDIVEEGFRIMRFDLPPVRTGAWDEHMRRFEHFGIEEIGASFASIDYCRAYNRRMDQGLVAKYGAEYRKYRARILPPPNAGRYNEKYQKS